MSEKGIYSKHCWIDGRLQEATIYFENGIITQIQKGIPETFDGLNNVANFILMPGVIDAHVHVNEPGRTDWEGFDTATQAAAAGGITTFIDMPLNASPVTTTLNALKEKIAATEGKLHVNCGFYGGLVTNNQSALEALIKGGVYGIKAFLTHSGIDEFPHVGEKELNIAMPLLAKYNLPLLVHCELPDSDQSNLSANPTSYQTYLKSRPKSSENSAISLVIALCRKHQCAVHIVHVSSAEALNIIQKAKDEGLPVTAETCPHYLYFNAEKIPDGNTLYKCAPPIREKSNNDLLKKALKNNTLDFIASDHSPAPASLKEIDSGNLQKAWGGIAGLQFLLPAGWSAVKEIMTLEKFIPLLTEHPAQFLKIDDRKGFLKEGFDADLVIWRPEERFVVKEEAIFHKHKISPYVSQQLWGTVYHTYINGNHVFNGKKNIFKNAGKWLLKK